MKRRWLIGLIACLPFLLGAYCAVNIQEYQPTETERRATAFAAGEYPDEIIDALLLVTPFFTPTATISATTISNAVAFVSTTPDVGSSDDGDNNNNNNDNNDSNPTKDEAGTPPPKPVPSPVATALASPTRIIRPSPSAIPPAITPIVAPPSLTPRPPKPPTAPPAPPPTNDDKDDDNNDKNPPKPNVTTQPTNPPATSQPPNPTNEPNATKTPEPTLPHLTFSDSVYQVNETEFDRVIRVTLSSPVNQPIEVTYATQDETATAYYDYQPATGILTFNPGETSATFSIGIINDITDDPDIETVRLSLLNASANAFILDDTATLEILDDDQEPTLQFSEAMFAVAENQTSWLTVTLSHPSGKYISVNYATQPETLPEINAVAGHDYQALGFGALGFGPDNTGETPLTVTFQWSELIDDSVVEADEIIGFQLGSPFNATLGAQDTTIVTIIDNDG